MVIISNSETDYHLTKENKVISSKLDNIYKRGSVLKKNENQKIKEEKVIKKRSNVLRTIEELKIQNDNVRLGKRLNEKYLY